MYPQKLDGLTLLRGTLRLEESSVLHRAFSILPKFDSIIIVVANVLYWFLGELLYTVPLLQI